MHGPDYVVLTRPVTSWDTNRYHSSLLAVTKGQSHGGVQRDLGGVQRDLGRSPNTSLTLSWEGKEAAHSLRSRA